MTLVNHVTDVLANQKKKKESDALVKKSRYETVSKRQN